jgi:hypothetical protein
MENDKVEHDCIYLIGRLCLVRSSRSKTARYSTLAYCREHCSEAKRLGIKIDDLPTTEQLKQEYTNQTQKRKAEHAKVMAQLPDWFQRVGWANECIEDGTIKLSDAAEKQRQRKKEVEAQRQNLLDEMPSGFALAKNLLKHLAQIHAHYKKTKKEGKLGLDGKPGQIKVTDHHSLVRLSICGNCPDDKMVLDDNGVARCTLKSCGCYLNNPANRKLLGGRVEYWALSCDNGHWDGIDEEMRGGGKEKMDPRS